ncbi:MAG: hypothetical protein KF746_05440 [Chitinophagaceae bacterium]|nr:hypothetical protein [Chitinophagaceae bacterium]
MKLAFFSTTKPGAGFFVTFLRKKVTKKPPEIPASRQAGTTADFGSRKKRDRLSFGTTVNSATVVVVSLDDCALQLKKLTTVNRIDIVLQNMFKEKVWL